MTVTAGRGSASRLTAVNLLAQCGALGAVSIASLFVARSGGPAVVGEYALLRVLPWLFGVVLSCGLPTASAFFLAGEHGDDPRLRPTLTAMAVTGAGVGLLAWVALSVPMRELFLRQVPLSLMLLVGATVITQLWTVTAKACCQGTHDMVGANTVIVAEELWFCLVYPTMLVFWGRDGIETVVGAMLISGALASATGIGRLARHGFFHPWVRPSLPLARRIAGYGGRGQLGNVLWLMNLRFDFLLLGALAGPAVLGTYAVASKFAELMRLVPTALNYILYPRFATMVRRRAGEDARAMLPAATTVTLVLAPLLAGFTFVALPVLYGQAYRGAVLPAEIIIIGLSIEGAAAVASAFLLGCGRPTLNSLAMGAGLVMTLSMDIVLIPRYGALGGAVTSAVAYATTTAVLVTLLRRLTPEVTPLPWRQRFDPLLAQLGRLGVFGGRPRPPGDQAPVPGAVVSLEPAAMAVDGVVEGAVASDVAAEGAGGTAAEGTGSGTAPPTTVHGDTLLRRLVDIVVAGGALVLLSPVLALLAMLVKRDSSGPALYTQERVGRGGRPFRIYKFRSMVTDADRVGPLVSGRCDPRITRVGGWLRRTKLDELPQLINVVKGDMTLIGPRPEVDRYLAHYDVMERRVLDVRPGLTGAGQLSYDARAAGELDGADDPEAHYVNAQLHPKLGAELAYLGQRSLLRDLSILVGTVLVVVGRR